MQEIAGWTRLSAGQQRLIIGQLAARARSLAPAR